MAISLEHQIRNILEGRSKGTLEREKVQNVARPDSEPSKHAKTEEIQKKIIDEEEMGESLNVPTPSPIIFFRIS